MIIRVIETPTDFEPTLGSHSHAIQMLVNLPPQIEPAVRHATDAIFNDLDGIDSGERGVVSAYLEQIADPLETLRSLGLQLVAISTRGTLTLPEALGKDEQAIPWSQTYYFVAHRPCYFKADSEDHVHVLGVEREGARIVLTERDVIRSWGSREILDRDFEGTTPWCDTCFLHVSPE